MYVLLDVYYLHFLFFFFNDTATTEIYTLSLHDALPIRLARIEQPPDDGLVDGPIPLRRADHFLHDDAVAVDQEALRYAHRLVARPNRAARIVQDVEGEAHFVHERHDLVGAFLCGGVERIAVDTHRQDAEVGARELLVQPLHGGHFDAARRAPSGPHVDENHLAAVIRERHRPAGAEVGRVELWGGGPGPEHFDLGPQLDGQGHAEHERHPDARDQRPLLAVRHTVTRQRRRSSWTSRAGSALAKTAFPVTKVSAPAWCAAAIVWRVIPPSTSRNACERWAVSRARARRILSLDPGRNDCAPKPGFTDLTSSRSRSATTSSAYARGVPGLSASPASIPPCFTASS